MRWRALSIGVLLALIAPGPAIAGSPPLGAWCINADVPFSVPYPADWSVDPPDPAHDIGSCQQFGPAAGTAWIEMSAVQVCHGFVEPPISSTETTVGGLSGSRIELRDLSDPQNRPMLWYVVPLDSEPCTEGGRNFFAETREAAGGDYAENKVILDAMMAGLLFTATPDTAMVMPRGMSPWTLAGIGCLTLAGVALVARKRRGVG